MEESFEEKLRNVSLLDIYDDIAAISLTPAQLAQSCTDIPCSVNLKTGNILYSVEQKYKQKLVKYHNSKRLKWLNLNLKAIVPNPEEKLLKWQRLHKENQKCNWIQRKLHALDYFGNGTLTIQSEEPSCSQSLRMAEERRQIQHSRRLSYLDENTSCSTVGNTSTESVQTVIPSQQKNSEETDLGSPLIKFQNVSRSSLSSSSGELPSLVVEPAVASQVLETSLPSLKKDNRTPVKEAPPIRRHLMPESEGPLSEEAYATFFQDMQVTSTQEFG